MKITLLLLALASTQVFGLQMPIDEDNEARMPVRPAPDTIDGCTGNNAIENCNKCYNPSLQCNECMHSYYRTLDWLRCLSCPSNCDTCTDSNGDDVTECTKCDDSYYKTDDMKCDKCPGHCASCTMENQCAMCDNYYHMLDTSAGSQRKCLTCAANCDRCDDSTVSGCRECADGYYLTSLSAPSSCTSCVSGCAMCKDGVSCDLCQTGKTFDSSTKTCKNCIANCDICDTSAGCTKCDTGYSLAADKSICYDCSNCLTCPESGGCTGCDYGYILQDKMCYTCPAVDTAAVCTDCMRPDDTRARYFDAGNSECLYCPEDSVSCTTPTTGVTCIDGKYFSNPSCVACDSSCLTCSTSGTAGCTTCVDGKFVSGGPPGTCTACGTANCAICTDLNTCTECNSGFYLDPNDDNNCISCPNDLDFSAASCQICGSTASLGKVMDSTLGCTGSCPTDCLLCTDATSCDLCRMSYTWDPSTTACVAAGGIADLYVNDAGAEIMCDMGLRWNTTHCVAFKTDGTTAASSQAVYKMDNTDNIQYCVTATTTDTAGEITDCTIDTTLDPNGHYGLTSALIGCDFGYTLNSTSQTCVACDTAYILDSGICGNCLADNLVAYTGNFWEGVCTDCSAGCLECTLTSGTGSCTTCQDGKYADTTCKDVSCGSVDTSAECTECATDTRGTNWASGTCYTCPEYCLSCSTDTDCITCMEGYYFDSGANKCIDCYFDEDVQCSTCGTATYGRYYDSSADECINCPDGCMMCADNSGTIECSECFANYYLDGSTLLCTSCPASPSTSEICDTCKGAAYYFDDGTSTCTACPTNCADCNAAASCTTCNAGYYWDAATDTTKCQSCMSSCSACSSGTSCTTCNSGKYFDGTACINCPSNCAVCDTASGCTTCNSGYYYTSSTKTCDLCSAAISNCLTCNSATVCDNCGTARYFKADTTECASCIANCDSCMDGTTCDMCSAGYCLDAEASICRSTSSTNCHTCTLNSDSEVTCLSCADGNHLEICTACEKSNCLKCAADKAECEMCAAGYFLEGISCTQCPGGALCLECGNADTCSTCATGYFFDSAAITCSACPSGCSSCTSATTCAQCTNSNSFFDSTANKCTNCFSGCKSCTTTDACSECMDSYADVMTDGKITECRMCPNGCEECVLSGEELVCQECRDAYFMKDDLSCEQCSSSFAMCGECMDIDNDGTITAGECMECVHGATMSDDETKCHACSDISGCGECADLPMLCLECGTDFYPTEDLEECHPGCYHCTSEDNDNCVDNVGKNNTFIEACPGLGVTASCQSVQIGDGDNAIVERYCGKNDTCAFPGDEVCMTADQQDKECKICCNDPLCNTMELTGQDSGAYSVNHQMSLLAVILAVASYVAMER